jgi:hypothetical protein
VVNHHIPLIDKNKQYNYHLLRCMTWTPHENQVLPGCWMVGAMPSCPGCPNALYTKAKDRAAVHPYWLQKT